MNAVEYTLRISDEREFIHGTWTIAGDSTLPADPWVALVIGARVAGYLVVEYYDPRAGQCRLEGIIEQGRRNMIAFLVLLACVDVAPAPEARDGSGTWRETKGTGE